MATPVNNWFRKMANAMGLISTEEPEAAISDISVTGTYADDDDAIEAAVNGILAALRSKGIIET